MWPTIGITASPDAESDPDPHLPARGSIRRTVLDRIEAPRGGPPPPTLFCPAHGGRIGLRGRTLGCTLKKVGILSLFSLFGIFGSFCIFGIVDFRRHVLEDLLGRNLPKIFKK